MMMPTIPIPPQFMNMAITGNVIHMLGALEIEHIGSRRNCDRQRTSSRARQVMVMPAIILPPEFVDMATALTLFSDKEHVLCALRGERVTGGTDCSVMT